MFSHLGKTLVVISLTLLSGCGATEKPALLEPPFESVEVDSVRASDLWPVVARTGRVVVTDRGEPHDAADVTANIGPGVWRMNVGGFWVVDVVRDADGGVSAIREVEPAEERRVEYNPPLPLLPAELRPGETVERTSTAYLYNHANGVLEATGECTATYQLLGIKPLKDNDRPHANSGENPGDNPGENPGEIPGDDPGVAYIVEVNRRYDMPLVVVDMRILSAYVPGRGPVAGKTVRVVKLLGMIPMIHEQRVERVD